MFDRYISAMLKSTTIAPNFVESELKGVVHDRLGTRLRFMICLYLCIKYFSSIRRPVSFDEVTFQEFNDKESKLIAESFEGGLIMNCLQYDIYHPTIYEAADDFGDKLTETDVRDLVLLYTIF